MNAAVLELVDGRERGEGTEVRQLPLARSVEKTVAL